MTRNRFSSFPDHRTHHAGSKQMGYRRGSGIISSKLLRDKTLKRGNQARASYCFENELVPNDRALEINRTVEGGVAVAMNPARPA